MDEIIKEVVSQKLRKRGADYNLGENSKLANVDFTYASRVSSKIYQYSKKNWREMTSRSVFNRLTKKVSQLVRLDEEHELGQLRIGYGNSSTLKEFRWNKKRTFYGLVPWQTEIRYREDQRDILVKILDDKLWRVASTDKGISSLCIRYHALKVPFELDDEIDFLYSKELHVFPGKEPPAKETEFSVPDWDNCLIVVTGVVRCRVWHAGGKEDYLSNSQAFMAADILEVFRIRNGKLMKDVVRESTPVQKSTQEGGTEWV
ncbi:hypothetical protein [Sphingobacterium paucimobilis]|uniref:Uncharacterized protein n=1 Tax=Sphingobacterium paucimobilis HER1398 TaxID=1346330 RepID=U2HYC5_9SPHI|nr:hypothetical protein [Sphingobacterium paucimobilis]ERJ57819.1 hypothetical protein M472_03475 [Sphingobacterium paucimobilis HER1398]ERJ60270.1 hypothetical protein M472_16045 [Sphingobacterium paucimobilis HER1398]